MRIVSLSANATWVAHFENVEPASAAVQRVPCTAQMHAVLSLAEDGIVC
jgi:hypothetical protein